MKKEQICAQICRDLALRGWNENQLRWVRIVLSEEGYTDSKYAPKGGSSSTLENLNVDLTQKIDDERFTELKDSTNDSIPLLAQNDLTFEQVQQLPESEKEEYFEQRDKLISEQKARISNIASNNELKREALGIKTKEEKEKKFAKIPEKSRWGDGLAYHTVNWIADNYETMAKYLRDFGRQIYVFKLEAKLDKETADYLMQEYTNHILKQFNLCLLASNATIDLFDNIQDEKNRDTLLGWMQKGVDKFWNYGNHGAGEVDFIETGIITFKLAPDNKTIIRTSIKTPFTREQTGDKTIVEITDQANQIQIHCPNVLQIECGECGNTENFLKQVPDHKHDKMVKVKWDMNCGLDFNKPIIPDEQRDVFTGDLFKRAVLVLAEREASKAIETAVDNVITVEYKSPQQFYEQEMKKRGLEVTDTPKVIDAKPTKIKEENIDPDSKVAQAYNILYSRAGRKFEKSEWFSEQA